MTENTPPEVTTERDGPSAVVASEEAPYTGTTSDGQPTQARPPRKIKPPSASFLKSRPPGEDEGADELGAPAEDRETFEFRPVQAAAPPRGETLGGPPPRSASPEPQLGGPPPRAASPHPQLEGAAPRPEAPEARPSAEAPAGGAKMAAEVQELAELMGSLETLKFLQPRFTKSVEEGLDSATLVSFYRLTARALKDEVDQAQKVAMQFRREFERLRGRLNLAQAELAAAKVRPPQGDSGELPEATKATILKLEAQLEKAQEQKDRLLQDIQHMRNRAQMDSEIRAFKSKETFLQGLIPVVDSFHQAVASTSISTNLRDLLQGFELIHGLLMDFLQAEGLTEIHAVGKAFDPRFHEAIGHVETDAMPDDHVYDQFQCGYLLGERLLRPARVRVSRHPRPTPPAAPPPAPPPAPPTGQEPPAAEAVPAGQAQTSEAPEVSPPAEDDSPPLKE